MFGNMEFYSTEAVEMRGIIVNKMKISIYCQYQVALQEHVLTHVKNERQKI
jgi:hypothetical protein